MGIAAVNAGLRSANDLDAVDVVDQEIREVEIAGVEAIGRYAVDLHQHMIGVAAANADLRD